MLCSVGGGAPERLAPPRRSHPAANRYAQWPPPRHRISLPSAANPERMRFAVAAETPKSARTSAFLINGCVCRNPSICFQRIITRSITASLISSLILPKDQMRAAMAADVRVWQPQPADAAGCVPAGEPAAAGVCPTPASAGMLPLCQNRSFLQSKTWARNQSFLKNWQKRKPGNGQPLPGNVFTSRPT